MKRWIITLSIIWASSIRCDTMLSWYDSGMCQQPVAKAAHTQSLDNVYAQRKRAAFHASSVRNWGIRVQGGEADSPWRAHRTFQTAHLAVWPVPGPCTGRPGSWNRQYLQTGCCNTHTEREKEAFQSMQVIYSCKYEGGKKYYWVPDQISSQEF